ncbi:MAG: UvrD-helicase domain-containing protein, partial [Myxococcales bacterium]
MGQLGLFGDPPTATAAAVVAVKEPVPVAVPVPVPITVPVGSVERLPSDGPTSPPSPAGATRPPAGPSQRAPRRDLPARDVESGPFSMAALAAELNPPQLAAVVAPGGPMVVVAGAGSGKTRVITYRIARLVAAGSDPRRILSVTFTNKAAGEMRERVSHLLWQRLGVSAGGLWLGTFHALSARLLRQWGEHIGVRKDFVIYDADDQKRLLARVLVDLAVPERMFPVRQVLSAIDSAQNKGITASTFRADSYIDDVVGKAFTLYHQRLRAANATDFGGLL